MDIFYQVNSASTVGNLVQEQQAHELGFKAEGSCNFKNKNYFCAYKYTKVLQDTKVGEILFLNENAQSTTTFNTTKEFLVCVRDAPKDSYIWGLCLGLAFVKTAQDIGSYGQSAYYEPTAGCITLQKQDFFLDGSEFFSKNILMIRR